MAKVQTKTDPRITIVIGTYNRPETLQKLLSQLVEKSIKVPLEVLVFDQSSLENYKNNVIHFPKRDNFHLHRMEKPNTCKYLNLGWQKAKTNIVLYLDDDVTITDRTMEAHLAAYENSEIHGVAGRVINDGEEISKKSLVGRILFFGAEITKNFTYEKKTYAEFPYGCNMSFRKSSLENLGGFDEGLQPPIYAYNEVDMGLRVSREWENSIVFEPEALVHHHQFKKGGTRSFEREKIEKTNDFNYGYFLGKNFNIVQNIVCFLRRLPFQLVKEPQKIPAILQGFWHAKTKKQYLTPFNISLFLVFAAAALLRFWRVGDFFTFNFDEEYQANLAWSLVKNFHIKWIGVSASNVNYYLGPGFTYLNWFLFKLSSGDPVILGYFSTIWGLITMGSLYYVTKEVYGKRAALFAALIYGCSAFIMFFDRRFWNPTPIPFLSIWLFYSLVMSYKNTKWFILTAFLFSIFFHIHLSLMLFVPVIAFVVFRNIKKISVKTVGISALLYLVITSPLLVYDLVHNFDNLLAPIRFLNADTELNQSFNYARTLVHLNTFLSVLGKIWFTRFNTNIQEEHTLGPHGNLSMGQPFFILVSVVMLLWFVWKNYKQLSSRILLAMIGIIAVGFIFYPGSQAEYFMLGMIALLPIVIGNVLAKIPVKISALIGIIFVIVNGAIIFSSTQANYGLTVRKAMVKEMMKGVGDKTFYLETVGKDPRKYHGYGGWRHLFRVYGRTPTQSHADEFFGWIFPEELTNEKPKLRVVISEDMPYKSNKKPLHQFRSGAFYGYTFNND